MMKNKLGKPVSQRQLRVGEMIKQSLGMNAMPSRIGFAKA